MPVLNPGNCFGKTWLIEIEDDACSLFLTVEAHSPSDALDELATSETFGHLVAASDEDLAQYPADERRHRRSGQVLDLDRVRIHGQEGSECPFPCLYRGDDLPEVGLAPDDYGLWQEIRGEQRS